MDGRTSVAGLFAVGEAASTGVHGANRLASNSLTEALIAGRRVGDLVGRHLPPSPAGLRRPAAGRGVSPSARPGLAAAMSRHAGVLRDRDGLELLLEKLEQAPPADEDADLAVAEATSLHTVSVLVAVSALARAESRGCHRWRDVPSVTADAGARHTILRARGGRWYCTRRGAVARTGLRESGGPPVRIIEAGTGRLVGTVDEPSAHVLVHAGAVYPHQGEMYVVGQLDLASSVALVEPGDPGYATSAREVTQIEVAAEHTAQSWGEARICFGDVRVTRQVVSFARRSPETGRALGEEALDLPARTLMTRAVWWTISPAQRAALAADGIDLAGAAHAAEHASIGLLPLLASCDRWDVGGVSADPHPATGLLTVFVYDGHAGGAGFAERGFAVARQWLEATSRAISSCGCTAGCPSCIQSPKCGNGNHPLDKRGAVALLDLLLRGPGE